VVKSANSRCYGLGRYVRRTASVVLRPLIVLILLTGCSSHRLYLFRDVSPTLAAGETNLLANPSFESSGSAICALECKPTSGWSIEHSTLGLPSYARTTTGVVTGSYAESFTYKGQPGDNGVHNDIELYQFVAGPETTAGHRLTFTFWVSGTCTKCAPFIGVEAFGKSNLYLAESDQYFKPSKTPRPVQVSYVLPIGAVAAAAYLQVPEIYKTSNVRLVVDDASLVAESHLSGSGT
jgi:hypothetical protein